MSKKEVFKQELDYIQNINYKESAENLLELVPEYFFEIPASSTGKYHPEFASGEKGLVRHTKAAIRIAKDLLFLESYNKNYTKNEQDLLLIAILFHDTHKCGIIKEKYTKFDHPLLAANFIKENKDKTKFTDEEVEFIIQAISSHMGQWNTNDYSEITLPKPKNKYETFVHQCDYLASKKYINLEFDQNNNIIN